MYRIIKLGLLSLCMITLSGCWKKRRDEPKPTNIEYIEEHVDLYLDGPTDDLAVYEVRKSVVKEHTVRRVSGPEGWPALK